MEITTVLDMHLVFLRAANKSLKDVSNQKRCFLTMIVWVLIVIYVKVVDADERNHLHVWNLKVNVVPLLIDHPKQIVRHEPNAARKLVHWLRCGVSFGRLQWKLIFWNDLLNLTLILNGADDEVSFREIHIQVRVKIWWEQCICLATIY